MKSHDESTVTHLPALPSKSQDSTFLQSSFTAAGGVPDVTQEGIVAYWRMVMRHRWTVVLIACIGMIAGILFTLPQTPIFQARATLEVQGVNENFLNFKDLSPTSAPGGYVDPSYEILTDVKILESRSLLDQTVQRLIREKEPGAPVLTDRLTALRKLLRIAPTQAVKREDAIRAAGGGIQIKASGTTRIIEVTCDSMDPRLAADFANTLVDQFIEKNLQDRWHTTERTGQWLTKQMDDLKIRLEKSEDILQAYATAVGLQFTGGDKGKDGGRESVVESSVRLLQEDLLKARADRMMAQSKYELISSSPPEALPQVLDNATLHEYETKLTELRRQQAELSATLEPAHYKLRRIKGQIGELETAINAERSDIITRLGNDYKAAAKHEDLLSEEFGRQLLTVNDQAAKEVHYNILKREVDTNRQLYESMLEKVKESGIASAMRASNFRIVDVATPPGGPYKPNLLNNAMLGSMAGIFLGVVVVLLREQADRNIQQPGDSSQYIGIHELGVIPSERPMLLGRGRGHVTQVTLADGESEQKLELVTWQRQSSLVADCIRTVLTSIMFAEEHPRVLVIASANPAEGKTTVASNLAIAMAEISQRVLLIDADMRRPRIHKIYELSNEIGLSSLLQEKQPLSTSMIVSAAQETLVRGLYVLTSGPSVANAATLLYSARLPEILQAARQNFDAVIIDSPPMLHLSDSRLLGRHSDAVLLVLRAGKTTRTAGLAAKQKFATDGTLILGTILTDWNPNENGYGYDYKYYSTHAAYYTNPAVTNGNGNGNGAQLAKKS
jgi:succinoglycan biosynthesis transport protein ExoP